MNIYSFFFLFFALNCVAQNSAQRLPTQRINVCGESLNLEIADDPKEREIGLMFRTGLKPGSGMLFVFPREQKLYFWMRNVSFDIEAGFFNSKGILLNYEVLKGTSQVMRDEALPRYASQGLAQYVVEAPVGFFSQNKKQSNCVLSPLLKTKY